MSKYFRWLCSVRRNYRSVTYHNWRHAFNVCQLMFSIMTNTTWWKQLGEIECLALVIACLCHDLDHRGELSAAQCSQMINRKRRKISLRLRLRECAKESVVTKRFEI